MFLSIAVAPHFVGYSERAAFISSCTASCRSIPALRNARTTTSEQTPVFSGTSPLGYSSATYAGSYSVVTPACAIAPSSICLSCGEELSGSALIVGRGGTAGPWFNVRSSTRVVLQLAAAASAITKTNASFSFRDLYSCMSGQPLLHVAAHLGNDFVPGVVALRRHRARPRSQLFLIICNSCRRIKLVLR